MIEPRSVCELQRAPEEAFSDSSELLHGTSPARVPCGDASFEAMDAKRLEGKRKHQLADILEESATPPLGPHSDAPLRGAEAGLDLSVPDDGPIDLAAALAAA